MDDYGHIANNIPSLAVSVLEPYRGFGLGTDLIRTHIKKVRMAGYKQLSLSVQKENPAKNLYLREGFKSIRETDKELIMICDLNID